MKLVSSLYNRLLRGYDGSRSVEQLARRAMLECFIRALSWLGDPEVETLVRGIRLRMPISQRLPMRVRRRPQYDTLLTRLSGHLRARDGRLSMVDIGANIGDTVLACVEREDDRFLAVEPNPHFTEYLRKNCGHLPNVQLLEVICTASDGIDEFLIDEQQGTARFSRQPGGRPTEGVSVDSIVARHPQHAAYNLLKVDTDGHDFEVLRGARSSISKNHPAVLFECDVFGNERYVEDVVEAIEFFREADYARALVYDNDGYFFGSINLDRLAPLKDALLYQLASPFRYFDILMLPRDHADVIAKAETTHAVESIRDEGLRATARTAAQL